MSIWDGAPKNSREAYVHLRELAGKMRVETYGEIAESVGKKAGHKVTPIGLNVPLNFIRDEICRPRGLPMLNALAVNGERWLPGGDWLPEGVAFGDDERVLWRGVVLSVFSYPWDTVEP